MRKGYKYKSAEAEEREKAHWFGRSGGNRIGDPRIARDQREFYAWCECKATQEELLNYKNDDTKPYARRKFVQALAKCETVQDFFSLTDQTHGYPKQPIDIQELPKIECSAFGEQL